MSFYGVFTAPLWVVFKRWVLVPCGVCLGAGVLAGLGLRRKAGGSR